MKECLILLMVLVFSGCGTFCKLEERDSLLVLSDTQFLVGEDDEYENNISSLNAAISYLGPETNIAIYVTFCPGLKLQTTNNVLAALNKAGFNQIISVTDPKLTNSRCALTTQSRGPA